jgi:hypothetical protein
LCRQRPAHGQPVCCSLQPQRQALAGERDQPTGRVAELVRESCQESTEASGGGCAAHPSMRRTGRMYSLPGTNVSDCGCGTETLCSSVGWQAASGAAEFGRGLLFSAFLTCHGRATPLLTSQVVVQLRGSIHAWGRRRRASPVTRMYAF